MLTGTDRKQSRDWVLLRVRPLGGREKGSVQLWHPEASRGRDSVGEQHCDPNKDEWQVDSRPLGGREWSHGQQASRVRLLKKSICNSNQTVCSPPSCPSENRRKQKIFQESEVKGQDCHDLWRMTLQGQAEGDI